MQARRPSMCSHFVWIRGLWPTICQQLLSDSARLSPLIFNPALLASFLEAAITAGTGLLFLEKTREAEGRVVERGGSLLHLAVFDRAKAALFLLLPSDQLSHIEFFGVLGY